MKITIGLKIAAAFITLLILLSSMGVITYRGLQSNVSQLYKIEHEVLKQITAGNLRFAVTQVLMAGSDYISTGDAEFISNYKKQNELLNKYFFEFSKLTLEESEKKLLSEIKSEIDSIRFYSEKIFAIEDPAYSSKAINFMRKIDYDYGQEINLKTSAIFDGIAKRINYYRKLGEEIKEDQTESILAEEESKKARDASREAERLKSTFLNVLSHELRTPLNIILGYSTIIKENLRDKIGSEDKIYLDNLHSGSERLFKTITQMLEFAQIEAGNYHLNLETFELVSIFTNCIAPHKKRAAEKQLNFTSNFTEDKIFVEVDLQCAENIINNLLDNAVKFTRRGYIDVEVGVLKDRELAICKIKDTGVGISTEYLEHLYQPFSQEDLDIGRTFEGNGLGLAISKRYIERMGGSLIVDSIKGVGSTFTFTLPLAKGAKAEKLRAISRKDNGTARILMLDDAGESYDLIKAFLKESFEINLLKYVDFNPDLLNKEKFSAVIFDVTKNYWDRGLDFCRNLKKSLTTEIPIIVLSSEFLSERIDQFYQAGADEFLVKPFAKNELIDLIKKVTSAPQNTS